MKTVKGSGRGFTKLEPFGEIGEDGRNKQCRMSFTQFLDSGGWVPTFVLDLKIPESLARVEDARSTFSRGEEVDLKERNTLAEIMKNGQEGYDTDERKLIDTSINKFGKLKADNARVDIESPDPLVTMSAWFNSDEDKIIGRATTEVDASIEECASWFYIIDSREKWKRFEKNRGVERKTKKINDHCFLNQTVYDLTGISSIYPREFVSNTIWKWEDETKNGHCNHTNERQRFSSSHFEIREGCDDQFTYIRQGGGC